MSDDAQSGPKKQGVPLQLQLDETVAQGAYANLALVNHSETEFVLDFAFVVPLEPKAKIRARIISSPKHTKRVMLALQENMARYEARFGAVDPSPPLPPTSVH